MNNNKPLFEFNVIVNPQKSIFSPKRRKLMIFDKHLVFEMESDSIEILYSSITSIRSVRSRHLTENKAYLSWDNQELTFGVGSAISRGRIDINLTEQVVNIILALRDKTLSQEMISELFSWLKPRNLALRKIKLQLKALLLLFFISGLFFLGTSVLEQLWLVIVTLFIGVVLSVGLRAKTEPRPTQKKYALILYYLIRGDMDAAILEINKSLEKYPNDLDMYLYLVQCYMFKKDWANAQNYCQKVLSLSPNNPKAEKILKDLDAWIEK